MCPASRKVAESAELALRTGAEAALLGAGRGAPWLVGTGVTWRVCGGGGVPGAAPTGPGGSGISGPATVPRRPGGWGAGGRGAGAAATRSLLARRLRRGAQGARRGAVVAEQVADDGDVELLRVGD